MIDTVVEHVCTKTENPGPVNLVISWSLLFWQDCIYYIPWIKYIVM